MLRGALTAFLLVFFLIVIALSFNLSYTGSIVGNDFNAKEAIENPEKTINDYNQGFENIPSFARTLLGNERMNLIVKMDDGSKNQLGLVTKEGKIVEYSRELLQNATIDVITSEDVMNSIAWSGNPSQEFGSAIDDERIKLEPKRFTTSTKSFIAKIVLKIRSWF